MSFRWPSVLLAAMALLSSCSTTRSLHEGQYRLASNEIRVGNDPSFRVSELTPYIQQKSNTYLLFGWSPGLYIYNWGAGSDGVLAKTFRKIGQAPVVFDASRVGKSEENIASRLETLGYYNSEVSATVDTMKRLARVRYDVMLGNRYPIDRLDFDISGGGRDFLDDFAADSVNITVRPGTFLSEQALKAETLRGASYFRNHGYYDFSPENYFFTADTLSVPGRTSLLYSIRPYGRGADSTASKPLSKYRIGKVAVTHSSNVNIRSSVVSGLSLVRTGDFYNAEKVSNTYKRFANLGMFSGVSVEMTPSDSATVDCDIRLTESYLQGIKVSAEASSSANGLFSIVPQVSWHHKNVFGGGERLSLGFTGNFQFKGETRATEFGVTSALSFPRFLGLPYSAFRGAEIPRTDVSLAYNFQNRPEFRRNIFSASFNYNGSFGDRKYGYQISPLRINYVRLAGIDESFRKSLEHNPYMSYAYQDHLDIGVGGTFSHQTDPSPMPAGSYSYSRLGLDLSGNVASLFSPLMKRSGSGQKLILGAPYTQFVRAELNLGNVNRWGRNNGQALAVHFVAGAGYAYGNSTALPFERQFYVGGASSMRAWQPRTLGPGAAPMDPSFSIPSQAGDLKLELDLEYRFLIYGAVEGALFAESGNVWTLEYENESTLASLSRFTLRELGRTLAADWGFGIRVNLSLILFRVDLGCKIFDPSQGSSNGWYGPRRWFTSDGCSFHFGVGYPF